MSQSGCTMSRSVTHQNRPKQGKKVRNHYCKCPPPHSNPNINANIDTLFGFHEVLKEHGPFLVHLLELGLNSLTFGLGSGFGCLCISQLMEQVPVLTLEICNLLFEGLHLLGMLFLELLDLSLL